MSAPKHTPGPWQMDGSFLYGPPRDEYEKNGEMIASLQPSADICEGEANASLITAAPELLEIVEAYRNLLRTMASTDGQVATFHHIESVIARATGKEGA